MSTQASFTLRGRNPDVLTCIANLSNDEVFTPPDFANRMLDTLAEAWAANNKGANIWADPTVTFLDPCTKSGVFLREITSRLTEGLKDQIPDLRTRVDHILTKQVFGIGITHLTSLLARRSVYCSKHAKGAHSIGSSFATDAGNIWFERMEHTWKDEKCTYCGASQNALDRGEGYETHAYALIHTKDIKARITEIFGKNMQFDVIIGNPPYQLGADGGTRDVPIYQHFVEQAKKLEPRFLSMIIPSRWMAGGLGLDAFRKTMLSDRRMAALVDYLNAAELFPSVGINGGICYFLWDAHHNGECATTLVRDGQTYGPHQRWLDEFDVLVRDVRGLAILNKVLSKKEPSLTELLSADKEFGMTSNFDGHRPTAGKNDIALYYNDKTKRQVGWMKRSEVPKSQHLIDKWKVLVPKTGSGREREKSGVDMVLGPSLIAAPPSVCTQTYLFFFVDSERAAKSVQSYLRTRFARFIISLRKITQDANKSTYTWVPQQTWDRDWTDAELYKKYGITEAEKVFIESIIRPMNAAPEANDE
ncbi:MAG TPA: Eco57I restriction-modification methylase domain-containing protein [Flavobacteriales bacterium]|nr:Eco57I restriction-modification methylase domain-containing protein [Flavobacteriales bacterium]